MMKYGKLKISTNIYLSLIIFGSVIVLVLLANKKIGMHEDEYYSYMLANYENGMSLSELEGITFESQSLVDKVFDAETFSIRNVWNNQKNDVHPPMYYLILHIVSVLFGNFWGLKTGIIINIVLHIFNIIILYMTFSKLNYNKYISLMGCFLYSFEPIILGNILFIRMYTLFCMFSLLFLYTLITQIDQENKAFYIKLLFVSIGGVLTHYYFFIYLFFCCASWGALLIWDKAWSKLCYFIITMIGAVISSILIFPYMIEHIFGGYRGEQSFDNLVNSDFIENLCFFYGKLNTIFGRVFFLFLLIGILEFCYKLFLKANLKKGFIIFVPSFFYFIMVTKIAVMSHERYIVPIYVNILAA